MQPNTTYVMDPNMGPHPTGGQAVKGMFSSHKHHSDLPPGPMQANMGPAMGGYGGQTTTTTVTKEIDQHVHHPAPMPMTTAPAPMAPIVQDQVLDKHGKVKKQKKNRKAKKSKDAKLKGQSQVIVPPGPAIVPAVVIPVVGAPPMNSPFVQQPGNLVPTGGPMPAPTSGVLPPTGVQNPMTATLPINQQGLNPTTHLNNTNLTVQPPILSTPECNAQRTKEIISHQHPLTGIQPGFNNATAPGFHDPTVKTTYVEERKEVIGGHGIAGRPI